MVTSFTLKKRQLLLDHPFATFGASNSHTRQGLKSEAIVRNKPECALSRLSFYSMIHYMFII